MWGRYGPGFNKIRRSAITEVLSGRHDRFFRQEVIQMIRHVSAVAIAVLLNASTVSAQAAGPQNPAFTVTSVSANVHKSPSIVSPIIGKEPRGAVLEILRNLGSWVEVPWPGAEGAVAFVHVNGGLISGGPLPDPARLATTTAPLTPVSATSTTSGARAEQIMAVDQPGSRRATYVSLPSHTVGVGARMNASTPGFGATARTWWGNRLGLQLEMSRYVFNGADAPGHMTSLQFSPSVLYSLPDGMTGSFWLRPYLGAGPSWYRASGEKALGYQVFGGAETTFSGAPRLVLSADIGYQRSRMSVVGFEPNKIALSLSGHWYVK
jgi:hypothetical protein